MTTKNHLILDDFETIDLGIMTSQPVMHPRNYGLCSHRDGNGEKWRKMAKAKTPLFIALIPHWIHSQNRTTCSGLLKTTLNNVLLPTLFNVVNNIVQHCWAWISLRSGVIMLNNIVDNIEQCEQQNIVQRCFQQPWTGCAILAVCTSEDVCTTKRSATATQAIKYLVDEESRDLTTGIAYIYLRQIFKKH